MRKALIVALFLATPAAAQTLNNLVDLPSGSGYVDTQTRQVVRTSGGVVYICGVQANGSGNSTSYVTMYKGSPTGNPTSFTEMDSAHRPQNNARIAGAECRLRDGQTTIHVTYEDDNALQQSYTTFSTASDTWSGTIEQVGTFSTYRGNRYESKTAMALDASGDVWIAWGGGGTGDTLYISHRTAPSTYTSTAVSTKNTERATMLFDSSGTLHVAYMETDSASLGKPLSIWYRGRSSGGTWTSEERAVAQSSLDQVSILDNGPSLVLNPANGNPVIGYLTNSPGSDPNFATAAVERTGTDTWASVFSIPSTFQGHSPALYVDVSGNIYDFLGHTNSSPYEPHVIVKTGANWGASTLLAQDSTVRDASANIRYDPQNPSSTTDIDYVTMIENWGGQATLSYVHGTPPSATFSWFRRILGRRK